ncbi:MAG: fibronectin type III domain-containing protein [Labilithrix sp.]|nr:fibronectin type III domain-containing protein [Labilithrix sp.]
MRLVRTLAALTAVALAAAVPVACSSAGGGGDAFPEAAAPDGSTIEDDASPDTFTPDAADETPPSRITDLAGTSPNATSVLLTWTAPSDDSGHVAAYELRVSETPITDLASFVAATPSPPPTPVAAGTQQSALIENLEPGTDWHFALRARDDNGNWSEISNDAAVKTKPRAELLIAEVAVSNGAAQGFDFVELVATKAGSTAGIEIKQINTVLYRLADLELAVGDRVVVHVVGTNAPDGFSQEDVTKDKTSSTAAFASATAYDVYSTTSGLTGTDSTVSVAVGTKTLDFLAYANRDDGVAAGTMTAFAKAKTEGTWVFGVTPEDGVNDCETERDAVSTATAVAETPCGGFKTLLAAGISINRNGVVDTNSKADFYLAPQSPGAANAAIPAPAVLSASATSATAVDIVLDQEIAPATVTPGAFTIGGLGVTAASASINHVVLATDAQADGGYGLSIAPTVTNLQGVAIAAPAARFCGYAPLGAALALSEVNPNLPGSTDLIELVATRGGSLANFTLRLNPTTAVGSSGTLLATLPVICAAAGDIVVVHLTPAVDPATSETLAKDQHPQATYAQNYNDAWDVRGGNTGLATTHQVITIRNPAGVYIDAVPFSNGTATTAAFQNSLAFIQAQGLWTPASCGGAACDDASTPTAAQVSAIWSGVGNTPAGASCRRLLPATEAASWAVGPSSFGSAN